MATVIPIEFVKFRHNHPPFGKRFREFVPDWPTGNAYKNTCCGQLSYAFNASSEPIAKYDYPDPITGKARAFESEDGSSYLLAVHDFRSYLGGRYGDPDRFDSKKEIEEATVGRVGIIAFGLMHIDVWSKGNIHRPSEFNLGYLWNPGHWEGEKLMFWDLPPPEGRHIEYQSAR